jgi:hypothetical protein
MRWMMSLVVALFLVPAPSRAQVAPVPGAPVTPPATTAQSARATAVIRGHVLAGDTGQPLRQAQVRLVALDMHDGNSNRVSTTDAGGNYEFTDLPAGRYNIVASKNPYLLLSYGQTRPFEGGAPLNVLDGQTIERVDFALPRGSVVRGRVFDEYGEPLPNLQVAAMLSQTVNGQRPMVVRRVVSTDDLGEFRLFGLSPGNYYVQATWRRMPGAVGSANDRTGYAPTFYPATTNAAEAQRVTVGIGTMTSDIVIAMTPITTAKISGTAVDSGGQPMSGMLMVMQSSDGFNTASGSPLRPDGSFVVAGLTPGQYILRAQPRPGGDETATMKVTVAGVDITDLRLVASRAVSVSGRVVVDPGQSLQAGALSIMAAPVQADSMMFSGGRGPGRVGSDNAFVLKSGPGQVRLRVLGLPKGWDVRTVRLRGVDVTDGGIEIKPNEDVDGVDVELTNRLTSVIGLVTDAHGSAAKDCTALIFPQDQNLWTNPARYIKSGRPDQDSRFTIAGLPPGDYYAVALDHLDLGKISDPEFLNAVRSGAKMFSLTEGETKPLDLKLSAGQ